MAFISLQDQMQMEAFTYFYGFVGEGIQKGNSMYEMITSYPQL